MFAKIGAALCDLKGQKSFELLCRVIANPYQISREGMPGNYRIWKGCRSDWERIGKINPCGAKNRIQTIDFLIFNKMENWNIFLYLFA